MTAHATVIGRTAAPPLAAVAASPGGSSAAAAAAAASQRRRRRARAGRDDGQGPSAASRTQLGDQQQLQQQRQRSERSPDAAPQRTPRPPAVWCSGLLSGSFAAEAAAAFPEVTWSPGSLARVLCYCLPAAAAAVLAGGRLALLLPGDGGGAPPPAAATLSPALQQALLHCGQEAALAAAVPAACWLALGRRVVAAQWDPYWVAQTLGTCAALFPLADPLLWQLWQPVAQAAVGPAPVSMLVTSVQQAADAGEWGSVGLHCVASGVLGPLWEEVFWRGFFLTALTKVLPLPACVAISAANFAGLHLSAHNLLPLLALGATCDCLYLRSGGNLAAPLLLHGLWNTSQVLQIALLHKQTFV